MAIENNKYTSVMIKKTTKEQLDQLKIGKSISYSKVIENLIQQTGGTIIEDVITIPPAVAFTLKYWDKNNSKTLDITFGDLMKCDVGEVFTAESNPEGYDWVNSSAKVLAKDGADVILRVTEVNCKDGKFSSVKSVVHLQLF